MDKNLINTLQNVIEECNSTIASELEKYEMTTSTPGDISSRYWLSNFLEPLNKKELKSICDSFLIQMLNEEQAKKIIKFLLIRFPDYYTHLSGEPQPEPQPQKVEIPIDLSKDLEINVNPSNDKPTDRVEQTAQSSTNNFEAVYELEDNMVVGYIKIIKTDEKIKAGKYNSTEEANRSLSARIEKLEDIISKL